MSESAIVSEALSDPQRFLVVADLVAQSHDYFHWRVVGGKLRWPDARCQGAMRSLRAQELLLMLPSEETKLLPAGRRSARALAAEFRITARDLRGLVESNPSRPRCGLTVD